jgi:hypothetical protein
LAVSLALLPGAAGCGLGDPEYAVPERPVPCPQEGAPEAGQGVSRLDARDLIGLDEFEAAARAARYGCEIRVVWIDGDDQVVSLDQRWRRIDVAIADGVVVDVAPG